ncbi:MAG TPA: NAD-dependent epimerase/dehydratase family protein [Solirubrobacteraceae bacterium]|nr:NAD-dependent epimerase/dehydratase family protein [Solirubrobacteraceae bacterium]
MARVFVTGASGFIGGALATRLQERGDEIVALARSDASAAALGARGLKVVRGDVCDEDSLARGMAGCELAYHVAGINSHCPPDPKLLLRVNARGPELVVQAAARAGVKRVVYTSSGASVGEPKGTIGREDSVHRGSYLSAYDRSKHEGEQAAFAAAHRTGVEVVAVNPSSVQGPGRTTGNGKLMVDYVNGKLPVFVDTYLSVVDIADTTEAHILAADRGRPGARYVLNGATLTSAEALELLDSIAGVKHRVRIVRPELAMATAGALEAVYALRGRVPSLCRARIRTFLHGHQYDGSLAERELGLVYTPVEETFRRTIEWARSEGLIDPA